ncbi:hypothetical protein [Pseudonocardia alni]|uniref:hypothetical protein n=1 Tax=Pseudonocardia alni TaxID=33907 RepID=UPI003320C64F
MTGPTPGQRLRQAAFDGALTTPQGRAIASILATLEVVDGNGTDVQPEHAPRLLDSVLATYRGELRRLAATERGGSQAAARRREQAARRPTLEAAAVENNPDVVRLDDRRRSRRDPGETDPGA